MRSQLLVIGRAADRSPPSLHLLLLLAWLRAERPDVGVEVVLLDGGPLQSEYRALASTTIIGEDRADGLRRRAEAGLRAVRPEVEPAWRAAHQGLHTRRRLRPLGGGAVVYVSDVRAAHLVHHLPPPDRVVLVHLHAAADARVVDVGATWPDQAPIWRRRVVERAHAVIVASSASRAALVGDHALDPAVVVQHDAMVDLASAGPPPTAGDRRALRRVAALPDDQLVVGASGPLGWSAGADMFLRLAWELGQRERAAPVSFVWAVTEEGCGSTDVDEMEAQARAFGLEGVVRFVPLHDDAVPWMRVFDLFVSLRRGPAEPHHWLAAAASACPCVVLESEPEPVTEPDGVTRAGPDIRALADAVERMLDDEAARQEGGARAEAAARDHDVCTVAPRLWADIERWLP